MNVPRKNCPKCAKKIIYDEDAYGLPEFVVQGHGDDRGRVYRVICSNKDCSNSRKKFAVKTRR